MTVRVIDKAFEDAGPGGRIRQLGEAAGYNEFEALGRLTFLWRHCRKARTQTLSRGTIRGYLGPEGDQHLLSANLGEIQGESIRVRGLGEVLGVIEKRARAGRLGGVASGQVRTRPSDCQANAEQVPSKSQASASQVLRDISSSDLFPEISSLSASSEIPRDLKQQGEGQKRKARKPETECPDDFAPDEWHRKFCADNRLSLASEVEHFKEHHKARGNLWRDWGMALRTWLRNQVKWRNEKPGTAQTGIRSIPIL